MRFEILNLEIDYKSEQEKENGVPSLTVNFALFSMEATSHPQLFSD